MPATRAEIVRDFVIRQLDAAPAISDAKLREQLQKVIGRTWAATPDSGLYVSSAIPWGARSTQGLWAVAYAVWLGTHGPGGTGVVIDSYFWESGRTHLVGRSGQHPSLALRASYGWHLSELRTAVKARSAAERGGGAKRRGLDGAEPSATLERVVAANQPRPRCLGAYAARTGR